MKIGNHEYTIMLNIRGVLESVHDDEDYILAMFSSISHNLEPDGPGARFPVMINLLAGYGEIPEDKVKAAIKETEQIVKELSAIKAKKAIANIEKPRKKLPKEYWPKDIKPKTLDEVFVVRAGKNFFEYLMECFDAALFAETQDIVVKGKLIKGKIPPINFRLNIPFDKLRELTSKGKGGEYIDIDINIPWRGLEVFRPKTTK